MRSLLVSIGAGISLTSMPLAAQVAPPSPATMVARPPGAFQAMFRSFLLPGWGQAALDRKLTGAIFVAFEGVAVGMALKAHHEMSYLERTGSERLESKRDERQDWIALIAFNHLMSGLEAFVAANLYDFPGDLAIKTLNDGRRGLGLTLPIGRR